MRSGLLFLLVAVLAGCSGREPRRVINLGPMPEPLPAGVDDTAPAGPAPATYPESSEVQALLFRARALREAGEFREALTVAEEALAIDPHSPSAAALRAELWAIVTTS